QPAIVADLAGRVYGNPDGAATAELLHGRAAGDVDRLPAPRAAAERALRRGHDPAAPGQSTRSLGRRMTITANASDPGVTAEETRRSTIVVTHFSRRPGPTTFSIERLFEDVRRHLPPDIEA